MNTLGDLASLRVIGAPIWFSRKGATTAMNLNFMNTLGDLASLREVGGAMSLTSLRAPVL